MISTRMVKLYEQRRMNRRESEMNTAKARLFRNVYELITTRKFLSHVSPFSILELACS